VVLRTGPGFVDRRPQTTECGQNRRAPFPGIDLLSDIPSTINVLQTGLDCVTILDMATIGYARISTTDQSLDRQQDELKAAGAEMLYAEVGSGKKGAERPKWDELLRSLRKGDTLVVTELSRLGRSTSQLSALADDLSERKVRLKILNLGIDTGTPAGKLVYSIIAAVAEMERDLLIERTNSGLAASRARGRKGGRKREFSPAAARKAQEQYDRGELSVTEIARLAGVSRQTLYRYLDITRDDASTTSAA
jgi:DNA invertase Pin-like site-specific DNA recombinase